MQYVSQRCLAQQSIGAVGLVLAAVSHLQREDVLPAVVADLEDARLRRLLLAMGHPLRQPLLQLDFERHQDGHLQTESRF